MSEKTLTFGNVIVNKKEFHASQQEIDLNLVDISKVVNIMTKFLNILLATKKII